MAVSGNAKRAPSSMCGKTIASDASSTESMNAFDFKSRSAEPMSTEQRPNIEQTTRSKLGREQLSLEQYGAVVWFACPARSAE